MNVIPALEMKGWRTSASGCFFTSKTYAGVLLKTPSIGTVHLFSQVASLIGQTLVNFAAKNDILTSITKLSTPRRTRLPCSSATWQTANTLAR